MFPINNELKCNKFARVQKCDRNLKKSQFVRIVFVQTHTFK